MGSQRYRRNYSLNAQNHGVAMYDRQRGPISNVPTDLTVGGDPPAADLGLVLHHRIEPGLDESPTQSQFFRYEVESTRVSQA